jgi:hypothetical protein
LFDAPQAVEIVAEAQSLGDETPAGRIAQRLIGEGLDRHDAILHAIGMVLGQTHNNTGRFRSCAESSNHGQLANSPALRRPWRTTSTQKHKTRRGRRAGVRQSRGDQLSGDADFPRKSESMQAPFCAALPLCPKSVGLPAATRR